MTQIMRKIPLYRENGIKARGKQNTDFKGRVLPSGIYGGVSFIVWSKLRGHAECLHYAEIKAGITLQAINTYLALIQQN